MIIYRHKQGGTRLVWYLLALSALALFTGFREAETRWVSGVVFAILLGTALVFASLTVEVTSGQLQLAFGPGWIRRTWPVGDIVAARAVTNPWYYGWGIHLTRDGWLYNVAGSQAVEVEFHNGRKVRLGTDEPSRLVMAIQQANRFTSSLEIHGILPAPHSLSLVHGGSEEAATFYVGIFQNSKIRAVTRYSDAGREVHHRPAGSVMTVEFELDGHTFTALNGGPLFKFNEAISFQVDCKDQAEIDYYWEKLGSGGDPKSQQCGWLKDKFGLSWQVTPKGMEEMLKDPESPGAKRAMLAILGMKKLDMAALKRAYEGKSVRLFVASGVGALLGIATAHALALRWWTLLVWSVAGLLVGWVDDRAGALTGAGYGFGVGLSFLIATGGGVLNRLPFLAVLSGASAMCGAVLGWIGATVRRTRVRRPV